MAASELGDGERQTVANGGGRCSGGCPSELQGGKGAGIRCAAADARDRDRWV